jgi:hypothetical protein
MKFRLQVIFLPTGFWPQEESCSKSGSNDILIAGYGAGSGYLEQDQELNKKLT